MELLMIKFLHSLRSKYSPQHPKPTFLPQWQRASSKPIQNNRQNNSLCILIFKYLDGKLEDKHSALNDSKHS
jgi:hypothetical protein